MDDVEAYSTWFKEQDEMVADLSKKTEHPVTDNLSYGLEGSFRKLCVD